ncbi:MAG: (d)CMP kinase [Gammaproteobacteria bacterium]|nr:(d)CMP kinase [Gammaproteobacteria bacterium]
MSVVITVDGPSGVGKGTLAIKLAQVLGFHLLDSGAIYRVIGVAADRSGIALDDENALVHLAEHSDMQFVPNVKSGPVAVMLDGEDLTVEVRTEKAGNLASMVAVLPALRAALLQKQKDFSQAPGLVADGRDMGTVVFPEADLKFFLDASAEVRAERRVKQLQAMGRDVIFNKIYQEVMERDQRDRNRKVAPLAPADDAILIDTSTISAEQVFEMVKKTISKQLGLL